VQPILHITSTSQFSLARGLPYIWILVIVSVLLFIVQTYLSLYLFSVLVSLVLSPAGQLMMSLLLVGLNLVFSFIGLSSNLLLIVLIFNLKGFAETEIILSDLKLVQLLISNLDYEFFVFLVFLVIFVYPPLDGLFFSLFLHYCFLI
jgi:hypothetical protein